MAHRCAQCVSSHVWAAGGQRHQEQRGQLVGHQARQDAGRGQPDIKNQLQKRDTVRYRLKPWCKHWINLLVLTVSAYCCCCVRRAAAAQVAAVAVTMACARSFARERNWHKRADFTVANPMATNAANPCTLWLVDLQDDAKDDVFALTMSSRLLFNASPTKLGSGCIMTAARKLASAELEECAISERMGSSNHMLEGICRAITNPGEYQLDAVWASWTLVVYLTCHPEGRVLLRDTALTDVDYQTAQAFEMYGRAEITRRARLEAQQQQNPVGGRKRKSPSGPRVEGCTTGDHADPPGEFMDVVDQIAEEEQRTLATKRKRGAKGCASASTSDSSGMLQWWYGALRCDNSSVLKSLIAHSKQAARDAATATLEKQVEGSSSVASNVIIRGISEQNAEASAKALVPFVGRRPTEIPALLAWNWNGKQYRGMSRTEGEGRTTTLHACYMASSTLQPRFETKMRIAWSVASMQYAPKTESCTILPSLLERLQGVVRMAERGKRGEMVASRMVAMVLNEAESPRLTALSGVTRSTLSMAIKLSVHESQVHIGDHLGAQLDQMAVSKAESNASGSSSIPVLLASEQDPSTRREPLCSPATRLALGIALNEELRIWMAGKSRKNDPCKVMLGIATAAEKMRDAPAIIAAEPPPLLTIVDFGLELLPRGREQLYAHDSESARDVTSYPDVDFGLALHVCGDGATRVPEMLHGLLSECRSSSEFVRQARASVWAAMSQASYICKSLRSPTGSGVRHPPSSNNL